MSTLEIRWPGSGTHQVIRGLRCGQRYRVREGEAPVVRPRHPVTLGGAGQDKVADGRIGH